jgi:engulfment/cell motility protein 1
VLNGNAETLDPPSYIPKTEENFNFDKQTPAHHHGPVTQGPMPHSSPALSVESNLSSHSSVERLMANMDNLRPLFFDWPTLHFSGVSNFLRLWQASSAEIEDFENITMVVKILFEKATQHAVAASSSSAIDNVVSKLDHISYDEIRATQLKQVENRLNNKWGDEIRYLHRQYYKESQDFVREQRIRLLLNGDWFFVDDPTAGASSGSSISSKSQPQKPVSMKRYFIALSPSRKSLQYGQFPQKLDDIPNPDQLSRAVDLQQVSKVVITPLSQPQPVEQKPLKRVALQSRTNYTKISLIGNSGSKDGATLSFYSDTPEKAAAWGDGLLMLKNRSFQSADTKKYIDMFAETKLRMQILNLSPQDLDNPDVKPPQDIASYDRSQISTSFYYR